MTDDPVVEAVSGMLDKTLAEREAKSSDQSGSERTSGSLTEGEQSCLPARALPASRSASVLPSSEGEPRDGQAAAPERTPPTPVAVEASSPSGTVRGHRLLPGERVVDGKVMYSADWLTARVYGRLHAVPNDDREAALWLTAREAAWLAEHLGELPHGHKASEPIYLKLGGLLEDLAALEDGATA